MKVLAILPGLIPSTTIGVAKPLSVLAKEGLISLKIRTSHRARERHIHESDVVVFCRNSEHHDLALLYEARREGKYIIYDIDDNFAALPLKSALGVYHRWGPRIFALDEFLRVADFVQVYSNPMLEYASHFNPNVRKIRSYFDIELIEGLTRPDRNATADRKVKICYQTSRGASDTMMKAFLRPLDRVLSENPGRVEFHYWGPEMPPLLNRSAVRLHKFEKNYAKFVRSTFRAGFDMGLAPMEDNLFSRSKTNNKFREYGALGIAGIYTKMPVYEECVIDRENGLLVDNSESSWYDAISTLVLDDSLRFKISAQARVDVDRDYSIAAVLENWRRALTSRSPARYVEVPPPPYPRSATKRVLIMIEGGVHNYQPWYQPLVDVGGFTGADMDIVSATEAQAALLHSQYDAVAIFAATPTGLKDAVLVVGHLTRRVFATLIYQPAPGGVEETLSYRERQILKRERVEMSLELESVGQIAAALGHVQCIVSDHSLVPANGEGWVVLPKPDFVEAFSMNGPPAFWMRQITGLAVRRNTQGFPRRLDARISNAQDQIELLRINLIKPFPWR
jgi:hypothetical protein